MFGACFEMFCLYDQYILGAPSLFGNSLCKFLLFIRKSTMNLKIEKCCYAILRMKLVSYMSFIFCVLLLIKKMHFVI